MKYTDTLLLTFENSLVVTRKGFDAPKGKEKLKSFNGSLILPFFITLPVFSSGFSGSFSFAFTAGASWKLKQQIKNVVNLRN